MNTVTKPRIRIYASVRQNLELAKKIFQKHMAEGNSSLLCGIEGFSWESTGAKINFCYEKHKEAISLSKKVEEVCRQRDSALSEIMDIIGESKSILQAKYIQHPEKIKDWGFSFHDVAITNKVPP